jgi:hypothetical protein
MKGFISLTQNQMKSKDNSIIDTPANHEWMGNDYDYEQLIKPVEIGEVVHSIFFNYRIISGTVIKLPGRLKIKQ